MRFAITGCDRYARVFDEFLAAGWKPVKLFSSPVTSPLSSNSRMISLATKHGCPVQLTRIGEEDLINLALRGCDALVVASYDWRIGDWSPYLKYAVNFHPSPLPLARGPYPLPRAILEQHSSWAMSCHKITEQFDSGDILASEEFALHAEESHESLNVKLQMAGGRLARRIAENFTKLWRDASPQGAGEYWPIFTEAERTISFDAPIATITRTLRAFGSLESYAWLSGQRIYVRHALAWPETHALRPGSVVHVNGELVVVAAQDGMIALTEWGVLPAPPPSPVPI